MADANFIIRSTHYTPLRRDSVIAVVIQLSIGNMNSIRRVRFSLKTVAGLVFVLALAFAFPAQRYSKALWHSKLVAELETAGASVGSSNSKYHTQSAADRIYEAIGFPPYKQVYNLNIVNQDSFDEKLLSRGLRSVSYTHLTLPTILLV